MKALNLHAVGDLRYEEVPDPVREKGEVLMKVQIGRASCRERV